MIRKLVATFLANQICSFNRFHREGAGHTTERGSKLCVPLREALWKLSILPKYTTHWPGQVSNPGLSTRSPVHWPLGYCASEIQIKTSRFLVTQVFPRLREFVFLLLCGPIGSLCLFVFLFSLVRLAAVITMVFLFRHSTKISSITTDKLIFRGRLQLKPL